MTMDVLSLTSCVVGGVTLQRSPQDRPGKPRFQELAWDYAVEIHTTTQALFLSHCSLWHCQVAWPLGRQPTGSLRKVSTVLNLHLLSACFSLTTPRLADQIGPSDQPQRHGLRCHLWHSDGQRLFKERGSCIKSGRYLATICCSPTLSRLVASRTRWLPAA